MDTKDKQQDSTQDKKLSGHFQNRLVGVIVFVALGVIFLPDVLDGKKVQQEEQFAEIPLRPEVAELTLPLDAIQAVDLSEQQQALAAQESTDEASEVKTTASDSEWKIVEETDKPVIQTAKQKSAVKPVSKPETKPTKETPTQVSSAFTLQLGSFNNAANVRGLVSKLRAGGFNAYTLPVSPVDGKLTKVFVGPEISKSKLKSLQPGVEKLTKLKGRIVAYSPTAS
ncbi:cell division protein DedD [Shewanella eurypsychrophilus]|uniref:Cell division protein DedD n=1 Tax=Shewanella eurypsychrophilus TaxID=2593656 RepID=A0ABX6V647_9GAMM|nr:MULTISPECIES: cell division protein DedD [Shewanella]QFU22168.1 cell division protein DedD [Shewanella sp. YLB-09]QPG57455.1 cell division protein DedD [Shewanella eurypsychrophilus]